MTILVGAASWTDKSLVDWSLFQPPQAQNAEVGLRYYASNSPGGRFDLLTPSRPQRFRSWGEGTPRDFSFNVKAFRHFTGPQTTPVVLHKKSGCIELYSRHRYQDWINSSRPCFFCLTAVTPRTNLGYERAR